MLSVIRDITVCAIYVRQTKRKRNIECGWARIGTMETLTKIAISWVCRENFVTEKRRGYRINKWLVAAWVTGEGWKIFRLDTGKVLTNISFSCEDDCIKFGFWLDEHYKEMFDIWEVWPELDLLSVTRYTIPGGVEVYKKIDELQNTTIEKGELDVSLR